MAVFSAIMIGIGLAVSVAGMAMGYAGAQKQAKAQKQAIAAQREAEQARKRQMDLEAQRKRRDQVRQMQIARAQAVNNATNQGARSSSSLQGGLAAITAQGNQNILAIDQNQIIGGQIFDANMKASYAYERAADGGSMMAMGQGISSLGGMLTRNAGTIGRIGGWA